MNTNKLKEALIEMRHQRAILDTAIDQLEKVLTALNGGVSQETTVYAKPGVSGLQDGSIPSYGIQVLESNGKPMHIKDIAKKVSEIRGKETTRYSMESSLQRHMKSAQSKVKKISPGIYALTAWSVNQQTPHE